MLSLFVLCRSVTMLPKGAFTGSHFSVQLLQSLHLHNRISNVHPLPYFICILCTTQSQPLDMCRKKPPLHLYMYTLPNESLVLDMCTSLAYMCLHCPATPSVYTKSLISPISIVPSPCAQSFPLHNAPLPHLHLCLVL